MIITNNHLVIKVHQAELRSAEASRRLGALDLSLGSGAFVFPFGHHKWQTFFFFFLNPKMLDISIYFQVPQKELDGFCCERTLR